MPFLSSGSALLVPGHVQRLRRGRSRAGCRVIRQPGSRRGPCEPRLSLTPSCVRARARRFPNRRAQPRLRRGGLWHLAGAGDFLDLRADVGIGRTAPAHAVDQAERSHALEQLCTLHPVHSSASRPTAARHRRRPARPPMPRSQQPSSWAIRMGSGPSISAAAAAPPPIPTSRAMTKATRTDVRNISVSPFSIKTMPATHAGRTRGAGGGACLSPTAPARRLTHTRGDRIVIAASPAGRRGAGGPP